MVGRKALPTLPDYNLGTFKQTTELFHRISYKGISGVAFANF
ncbi:MAG: hypothetical protein WCP01_08355 [Methylococcaceae bacterium]